MKRITLAAAALSMLAGPVWSAGLERAAPSTRVLFEDGTYLEFSMAHVKPDLSGTDGVAPGPVVLSGSTGDLFDSYNMFGAAFKTDLNDNVSVALILDQPLGADTAYPAAVGALPEPSALYQGSEANLVTYQLTGQVIYKMDTGTSVYGGVRMVRLKADAAVPFNGAYSINAEASYGFGGLFGVAYERKDIALRIALTYYTEIKHDLDTIENSALTGGLDTASSFSIRTPDSVALEFQTGIAPKTLLFGSIRWVNWEDFDITPNFYPSGALVNYTSDWTTYTLGLGRKLTDKLSASVSVTHEPASDTVLTSLGPVDGRTGVGVGLKYRFDNVTVSGGVSYTWLGDTSNVLTTSFQDGDAWAGGIRFGFHL